MGAPIRKFSYPTSCSSLAVSQWDRDWRGWGWAGGSRPVMAPSGQARMVAGVGRSLQSRHVYATLQSRTRLAQGDRQAGMVCGAL
jgi:hypothetical protein